MTAFTTCLHTFRYMVKVNLDVYTIAYTLSVRFLSAFLFLLLPLVLSSFAAVFFYRFLWLVSRTKMRNSFSIGSFFIKVGLQKTKETQQQQRRDRHKIGRPLLAYAHLSIIRRHTLNSVLLPICENRTFGEANVSNHNEVKGARVWNKICQRHTRFNEYSQSKVLCSISWFFFCSVWPISDEQEIKWKLKVGKYHFRIVSKPFRRSVFFMKFIVRAKKETIRSFIYLPNVHHAFQTASAYFLLLFILIKLQLIRLMSFGKTTRTSSCTLIFQWKKFERCHLTR